MPEQPNTLCRFPSAFANCPLGNYSGEPLQRHPQWLASLPHQGNSSDEAGLWQTATRCLISPCSSWTLPSRSLCCSLALTTPCQARPHLSSMPHSSLHWPAFTGRLGAAGQNVTLITAGQDAHLSSIMQHHSRPGLPSLLGAAGIQETSAPTALPQTSACTAMYALLLPCFQGTMLSSLVQMYATSCPQSPYNDSSAADPGIDGCASAEGQSSSAAWLPCVLVPSPVLTLGLLCRPVRLAHLVCHACNACLAMSMCQEALWQLHILRRLLGPGTGDLLVVGELPCTAASV